MSEFKLAAGSHVKFGCISTQLYPILRHGLAADMPRQGFQEEESLPASGIMVGELMAYFAACAAFCKATRPRRFFNHNRCSTWSLGKK